MPLWNGQTGCQPTAALRFASCCSSDLLVPGEAAASASYPARPHPIMRCTRRSCTATYRPGTAASAETGDSSRVELLTQLIEQCRHGLARRLAALWCRELAAEDSTCAR